MSNNDKNLFCHVCGAISSMAGHYLMTGEAPEVGDKVFGLHSWFCLEAAF